MRSQAVFGVLLNSRAMAACSRPTSAMNRRIRSCSFLVLVRRLTRLPNRQELQVFLKTLASIRVQLGLECPSLSEVVSGVLQLAVSRGLFT